MVFEAVRSVTLEVIAASVDIPARRFVTFLVTAGMALPATAGHSNKIVGITLEAYDDSEADLGSASTSIPVALLDGAKVEIESGEALTVGDVVMSGNDGRAMVSTTTAAGTVPAGVYQELGIVVGATGDAGEIATIQTFRGDSVTTA